MKFFRIFLVAIFFVSLTPNLLGQEKQFSVEEQELVDLIKKLRTAEANDDKQFAESVKAEQYLAIFGTPFNLQTADTAKIKAGEKENAEIRKRFGFLSSTLKFENFKVNILGEYAVVIFKLIDTQKTTTVTTENHSQVTYFLAKKDGKWKAVSWQFFPLSYSNYPKSEPIIFDVLPLSEKLKTFGWQKVADDKEGDGFRPNSGDGKALHYFYEKDSDMIWFKYELYGAINVEKPAVTIAIDVDDDQNTGTFWYGVNSTFKFDKVMNFGISQKISDVKVRGFNGITSSNGSVISNWLDEKKNNLIFHLSQAENAYYLGVKRTDISPSAKKINIVGSVGSSLTWNDDIGEKFVTIEFLN